MPDYFERFATTTARVTAWAATMGKTLTKAAIDEASAAAEKADPLAPPRREDLTTEQWKAKVDLRRYKPGQRIGAGQFGQARLLESNEAGDPLLVVKTAFGHGTEELRNEARLYAQAGDHPNIVKCMGLIKADGGGEALVLEGVKGKTMTDSMAAMREDYESGELSHEEFFGAMQHCITGMLTAAAHLESVGVVHNDLRMDNVMCDETTGDVKLFDFGVGVNSSAGEKTWRAPYHGGTVSPEFGVAAKRELDKARAAGIRNPARETLVGTPTAKHDVFSVGASAYQMGEQARFEYNAEEPEESGKPIPVPVVAEFGRKGPDGSAQTALHKTDPAAASREVDEDTGQRKKIAGAYAAETSYTKFINWLMHPDPKQRPTASEALKHSFLTKGLVDEQAARNALMKSIKPLPPPASPLPAVQSAPSSAGSVAAGASSSRYSATAHGDVSGDSGGGPSGASSSRYSAVVHTDEPGESRGANPLPPSSSSTAAIQRDERDGSDGGAPSETSSSHYSATVQSDEPDDLDRGDPPLTSSSSAAPVQRGEPDDSGGGSPSPAPSSGYVATFNTDEPNKLGRQ